MISLSQKDATIKVTADVNPSGSVIPTGMLASNKTMRGSETKEHEYSLEGTQSAADVLKPQKEILSDEDTEEYDVEEDELLKEETSEKKPSKSPLMVLQQSAQRTSSFLVQQVLKKTQTNRLENILFRLKQPVQADSSQTVVGMVLGPSPDDSQGDDRLKTQRKSLATCKTPASESARRRSRKTQKEPTKRDAARMTVGLKAASLKASGIKLLERSTMMQDGTSGCQEKASHAEDENKIKQEENGEETGAPEWLICSLCETVCPNIEDLFLHHQGHTDAVVFPCAGCKLEFSSPCELKTHIEVHIQEGLLKPVLSSGTHFSDKNRDTLPNPKDLHENLSQKFEFNVPKLPLSLVEHTYTPRETEKQALESAEHHRCPNCQRVFTCAEFLQLHKCRKGLVTPFGCGKCGRCFRQFTNLIEHAVIHKGDTSEELECYECGEKFTQSIDLRKHVSVHLSLEFRSYASCHSSGKQKFYKGDNSSDCSDVRRKKARKRRKSPVTDANRCKICDKVFPHRSYLHVHMQVHDEKRFACDFCEKKFTFKKSLEIHLRSHTGEKPYHCEVCDRYFTRQDALNKHRRLHMGVKPYVCDICGRQFGDGFELRRHINSHSKLKPYKCTVCDKAYTDNSRLKEHMFRHTGNLPFVCERCGKGFARKYRYNLHMSHHKGEVRFTCEFCGKGFLRRSDYNTHKMTHTSDRPYKCKHCGMGFIRDNYLKRHEVVHSGEKPYKCPICGKDFARKNTLTRHKLTHGKKQDGCVGGSFGVDYEHSVKEVGSPLDASDAEERDILKDIQAVIGVSMASMFE